MSRKFKSAMLLIVCFSLWSIPVQSADETGQILGGSLNSPIRIDVFSDFQCSHCRDFYLETIRPLLQEYSSKDKVCVIYHEFPLANHQYAREAAKYSEAAGQLGQQKLLPVINSLFSEQDKWAQDGSLEATVAKALPQEDFAKLKKILQDTSINSAIEKSIQYGLQKQVNSTPTLLITYTGKQQRVEGLVTYTVLKQFVDSVVK